MTLRKTLLEMLAELRTASSLARELGRPRGGIDEDLRHLIRSARAAGHAVVVEPARCKACGFTFSGDKLDKPGKCPACRASRILWTVSAGCAVPHREVRPAFSDRDIGAVRLTSR